MAKEARLVADQDKGTSRPNRAAEHDAERSMLGEESSPAILDWQRQVGNRVVDRLLHPNFVMRQDGESAAEEALETSFDTRALGKEERLVGHGNPGGVPLKEMSLVQLQDEEREVTAHISLATHAPVERFRPAAEIAAAHGRPGVAGWTTPHYDIQVSSARPYEITINVIMDYDIELASEYTGESLHVLRDHENGHVSIGNQVAQQHLVDGLRDDLEFESRLTPARIQNAIQTAANRFERTERQESGDYDAIDYPRMQQAYLGARTPLADLEATYTPIADLAAAVRVFNTWAPNASEERIGTLAQNVLTARDALSEDELSILQYSTEFKHLLETCRTSINQIIERFHWDLWIIEFSTLDREVRSKLDELRVVLDDFTWSPPV